MLEPAAPSPHLAFQLQTPVQNLTTMLQRKAVSPTAELTVVNPLKAKSPPPPPLETDSISGVTKPKKVGRLLAAAQGKRAALKEVEMSKGNAEHCLTIDVDKSARCSADNAEGKTEKRELPGKENVVASNQGPKTAFQPEQKVHKEVALGRTKASIAKPGLSDEKLVKMSSNSLVNTSFDMGAVVENIFEESMVLDGDEECCPTGKPSCQYSKSFVG